MILRLLHRLAAGVEHAVWAGSYACRGPRPHDHPSRRLDTPGTLSVDHDLPNERSPSMRAIPDTAPKPVPPKP